MITRNEILEIEKIIKYTDRAEAYYQLVSLFMNGPENVREYIRKNWDFGVNWIYPNCKRLACSKNELHSCEERLIASLAYYSIDDLRHGDFRDVLVSLAIIYHSCLSVGVDPNQIFETVASVSTSKTSTFLRDFINRSPSDKSFDAFMLIGHRNADGEIEIFQS